MYVCQLLTVICAGLHKRLRLFMHFGDVTSVYVIVGHKHMIMVYQVGEVLLYWVLTVSTCVLLVLRQILAQVALNV